MRRTRHDNTAPIILSCDPSFTAWGFVVMQDRRVRLAGCIKTEPSAKKLRIRKGDDRVRRASEIIHVLMQVIKENEVVFIVSELPHGSQNASAAVMIGLVIGILQTLSMTLDIPVEWYSEDDGKKAVTGRKGPSKQDIIDAVDKIYGVNWQNIKYKDEAVADALAIYHAASLNSPTLKFINR